MNFHSGTILFYLDYLYEFLGSFFLFTEKKCFSTYYQQIHLKIMNQNAEFDTVFGNLFAIGLSCHFIKCNDNFFTKIKQCLSDSIFFICINSRGGRLRRPPRSRCTGTRCWQGLVQGVTGFSTRYGRV